MQEAASSVDEKLKSKNETEQNKIEQNENQNEKSTLLEENKNLKDSKSSSQTEKSKKSSLETQTESNFDSDDSMSQKDDYDLSENEDDYNEEKENSNFQEKLSELRENFTLENKTAFLETVLFLESEPQSVENLSKITQLSIEEINSCLEALKEKYSNEDSGIELAQIIGGWTLIPKKEYFMFVRERYGKKNEGRLSKAAIETLTIIAYSQPITRAEIQSLRHVNVDNMMRLLLDRKFIKEVGKKDIPGKPTLYGTTKEFLEFFHLQSIADLPRLEEKESEVFELAR